MNHKQLFVLVSVLAVGAMLLMIADNAAAQGPRGRRAPAANVGAGFTYQGQLRQSGALVNSTCDFQFGLWDDAASGPQYGSTQTVSTLAVTNGLFTAQLDFNVAPPSTVFTGTARYLQSAVRCPAGSGGYTSLNPRQALTPAPYAFALPGLYTQQNATSPNVIGGYGGNVITPTLFGATIGGGGASGTPNQVWADYATVGGGMYNIASGDGATVGGGESNAASGDAATVGGGDLNTASRYAATVGGGSFNTVSEERATVGGGSDNTASGWAATVGGGFNNDARGWAATIGGGYGNIAIYESATVGGGYYNTASGWYSAVPGGNHNTASGDYSFAAGQHASTNNREGAFVWGDNSTGTNVTAPTNNSFIVRASGGITLYTNSGLSTGVQLPPGSGTWGSVSDRNAKANFAPTNGQDILARLNNIPIQAWNYKTQDASIRHIGPMAQDFYAAFQVGEDDQHITTVDADGVALAAIQGLYQENLKLQAESEKQQARIDALQQQNAALDARLAALEQASSANARVDTQAVPTTWVLFGGLIVAGWIAARRRA